MRFFDYKCAACNSVQEYYENYEDKEKEHVCPECGFVMGRMISAPQFNFKKPKVDIKHSERRKRWNSKDKREVLSI